MNISTSSAQVSSGRAYLNLEIYDPFIMASAYVYRDATIALMAWGLEDPVDYCLIVMPTEWFRYWMDNHRHRYGKVLYINKGGMDAVPPIIEEGDRE